MLVSDGVDTRSPVRCLSVSVVSDGQHLPDPGVAVASAVAGVELRRDPRRGQRQQRVGGSGDSWQRRKPSAIVALLNRRRVCWCLVVAQLTLSLLTAALHAALAPALLLAAAKNSGSSSSAAAVAYAVLAALACAAAAAEAASAAWFGYRSRSRRVAEQVLLDAAAPVAVLCDVPLAGLKLGAPTFAAAAAQLPLLRASAAAAIALALVRSATRLLHFAGFYGAFRDRVVTRRSPPAPLPLSTPTTTSPQPQARASASATAAAWLASLRLVARGLAAACSLFLPLLLIVLNLALLI